MVRTQRAISGLPHIPVRHNTLLWLPTSVQGHLLGPTMFYKHATSSFDCPLKSLWKEPGILEVVLGTIEIFCVPFPPLLLLSTSSNATAASSTAQPKGSHLRNSIGLNSL
jgi:hypothetical protein